MSGSEGLRFIVLINFEVTPSARLSVVKQTADLSAPMTDFAYDSDSFCDSYVSCRLQRPGSESQTDPLNRNRPCRCTPNGLDVGSWGAWLET